MTEDTKKTAEEINDGDLDQAQGGVNIARGYVSPQDQVSVNINNEYQPTEDAVNINNEHETFNPYGVNINNEY